MVSSCTLTRFFSSVYFMVYTILGILVAYLVGRHEINSLRGVLLSITVLLRHGERRLVIYTLDMGGVADVYCSPLTRVKIIICEVEFRLSARPERVHFSKRAVARLLTWWRLY